MHFFTKGLHQDCQGSFAGTVVEIQAGRAIRIAQFIHYMLQVRFVGIHEMGAP